MFEPALLFLPLMGGITFQVLWTQGLLTGLETYVPRDSMITTCDGTRWLRELGQGASTLSFSFAVRSLRKLAQSVETIPGELFSCLYLFLGHGGSTLHLKTDVTGRFPQPGFWTKVIVPHSVSSEMDGAAGSTATWPLAVCLGFLSFYGLPQYVG